MPVSGFRSQEPSLSDKHVYAISKTVLDLQSTVHGSANRLSIKGTCESLNDAPSYNWIYTVLKEEVFETASLDVLE